MFDSSTVLLLTECVCVCVSLDVFESISKFY